MAYRSGPVLLLSTTQKITLQRMFRSAAFWASRLPSAYLRVYANGTVFQSVRPAPFTDE